MLTRRCEVCVLVIVVVVVVVVWSCFAATWTAVAWYGVPGVASHLRAPKLAVLLAAALLACPLRARIADVGCRVNCSLSWQ